MNKLIKNEDFKVLKKHLCVAAAADRAAQAKQEVILVEKLHGRETLKIERRELSDRVDRNEALNDAIKILRRYGVKFGDLRGWQDYRTKEVGGKTLNDVLIEFLTSTTVAM